MKISGVIATALAALLVAACGFLPEDRDSAYASALAHRVVGDKASHFVFITLPSAENDYFTLEQRGGKLIIGGNNANSMAVGLNHYLKYYCKAEYGWLVGDDVVLPDRLPKVEEPVRLDARVKDRFFLNYCTFGYTMPWWQWEDWEHFIDWMALNGINLPLAITGQESIWYQIWTEMGLTDEEVRGYFTGPAHLPWHRMQNIDRWFSPLPKGWLDGQLELQKKITARERELGMRPVLPAFSGHVPAELARIYPDAPLTKLDRWCNFPDECVCTFLDPMSDLYVEIQKKFVKKETEIYGTDHIYGIDIFNELTPPSWEPEYLGRVSRQIFESLELADPEASWLQMGWLFYNERDNWTNDRVKAYLTSVPVDRQILLDYYCERMEVWRNTDNFFGVPYVWCYLGNFGGNTFLAGELKKIDDLIENTFAEGGVNFTGIGSTLEGFDCNPFIYEYIFEKAWSGNTVQELGTWVDALADRRIGKEDPSGRAAWKLLTDSVYIRPVTPGQSPYLSTRPSFGGSGSYSYGFIPQYGNGNLREVLRLMLETDGQGNAYQFDITNITRQMLSNLFGDLKLDYEQAYKDGDREKMEYISCKMLSIIDDVDRMVSTQNYFLVGKWIDDARSWGLDENEKHYFEKNARNILTTWSDADMVLNDYAARTWSGLTGSLYKDRWNLFFDSADKALGEGSSFDEALYHKEVTAMEKKWWDECVGQYPAVPQGDSKSIAKELYEKYKDDIQ